MIIITAITLNDLRDSGFEADGLLELLPESSRFKLEKMLNADSFKRSLLGELLARYTLKTAAGIPYREMEFITGEKGKPFLKAYPHIHFNITHSGEMIACAVASSDIGIDVEHHRKVNFRVAERFFSPAELSDLFQKPESERQDYFFVLWTIKESFLKAIGSGLTRSLNSFTVVEGRRGYSLEGDELSKSFSIKTYMLPGPVYMAVSCEDTDFPGEVKKISVAEIVKSFASEG